MRLGIVCNIVIILSPAIAWTQTQAPPDAMQVRYVSNQNLADAVVNVTNTGTQGGDSATGNICVNIYAFDPAEEMVSCCACQVTPGALASFTAAHDLINNTLGGGVPTSLVVKLVATARTPCNASSPAFANLASGMRAWATTAHRLPTVPGGLATTETPFSPAVLSESELLHLTSFCGFIQANGSGFGICRGCKAGSLGGDNQ